MTTEMRKKVGLPPRPFFYTPDQIATLLTIPVQEVLDKYLYYMGVDSGVRSRDVMPAGDIAPEGHQPQWRVAEDDFVAWLRVKGWRVTQRGGATANVRR